MWNAWKDFANKVDDLSKKIDATNPFSEWNYSRRKYSNFREFYYPREEHIMIWVEDDED